MRVKCPLLLLLAVLGSQAYGTPSSAQQKHAEHERQANLKRAQNEYKKAQELFREGKVEDALPHAVAASEAAPAEVRYVAYAALMRQISSAQEMARAKELSRTGHTEESAKLLQAALAKDPDNPELATAARENGLRLLQNPLPIRFAPESDLYEESAELKTKDPMAKRDFHLRGNAGDVMTEFLRMYGIRVQVDSGVQQRPLRFDAEGADYATALGTLLKQTHSFLVPASSTQAVLYNDTAENRANWEHQSVQTFDIVAAGDQQALNELINTLRAVFNLRFIGQTASGKLAIKGTRAQIEEAERFIEVATAARGEMMFDISEIEVTDSLIRQMGFSLPLQYQVLNVNTVLQQAGVSDVNTLINQINTGTLSQSSLTALSGILSQLQSQNAGLLTFGGGKTREALIVPPATLHFNEQRNSARILEHVSLRGLTGSTTNYHDGLRYPIVTTTFSTLVNSDLVNRLFGSQTLQLPPPAVEYVDLGLTLKITPLIQQNHDVRLHFELQLKNLTGQTVNQTPVLGSREFAGTVNLREGESAVLAGLTEQTDLKTNNGIPGLTNIGLAAIGGSANRNRQDSQILILVTPHSIRYPRSYTAVASQ